MKKAECRRARLREAPIQFLHSAFCLLPSRATGCDRKEFPKLPSDIATRPDRDALAELNAIVVRACQIDPSERYENAEEMHVELELLQGGKSIKRKRTTAPRLRIVKRICGVTASLAIAVATVATIQREMKRFGDAAASPTDFPSF